MLSLSFFQSNVVQISILAREENLNKLRERNDILFKELFANLPLSRLGKESHTSP